MSASAKSESRNFFMLCGLFAGVPVQRNNVQRVAGYVVAVVADTLKVAQQGDEVHALFGVAFASVQAVNVILPVGALLRVDLLLNVTYDLPSLRSVLFLY